MTVTGNSPFRPGADGAASIRRKLTPALLVPLLAVGVTGAMVLRTTSAALTATTGNAGNAFTVTTIDLTDNDGDVALFTVPAMAPGDSFEACIRVTYDSPSESTVDLFLPDTITGTTAIATALDIAIGHGTDATPGGACTEADFAGGGGVSYLTSSGDTIQSLIDDYGTSGNGVENWTVQNTVSRDYYVRVTMNDDVTIEQGTTLGDVEFTWQSTTT